MYILTGRFGHCTHLPAPTSTLSDATEFTLALLEISVELPLGC